MTQRPNQFLPGITGPMTLYHYWRSTSSWRVRWILAYKKIEVDYVPINLLGDDADSPTYLKKNPMGFVPLLEVPTASKPYLLTESTAIAEWVEELQPTPALLPANSFDRAQVRALVQLVNSGIQPLGNLTTVEKLSEDPEQRKAWTQHWVRRGFHAFEKIVEKTAGTYAFGDSLTLADIFLVPQCYAALRNDVSLDEFPIISRLNMKALSTESGKASHPDCFKPTQ
jgi:maleylacetoacetate isomerase